MRAFRVASFLLLGLVFCALAGRVERVSYSSPLLGRSVEYIVALPDSYDARAASGVRFPVLYLLHCAGCRAGDWATADYGAQVDLLVDSVQFIVAAPDDGNVLGWWLDSPVRANSDHRSFLVREFKPRIDSLYATFADRANNGLAGHSMGGFGALHNLIEAPDVFGAAYSIKGAVDLMPYPNNWGLDAVLGPQSTQRDNWLAADVVTNAGRLAGKNTAIRFYSGPNDWFYHDNQRLDSALTACQVQHAFVVNDEVHYQVPFESMKKVMMFFDSVFTRTPGTIRPAPSGKGLKAKRQGLPRKPGTMNLRGQRVNRGGAGQIVAPAEPASLHRLEF